MSVEFLDTNILLYAEDRSAGSKHRIAVELIARLATEGNGALSTQVLSEYYNGATKKLRMSSDEAEETIRDLAEWKLHRPAHGDILKAIGLQRRYLLSWWDAMVVNSAIESSAVTLWSEDLSNGQKLGSVTIRNPFA